MSILASKQVFIDPNNVSLNSLVEKDTDHIDINFIARNNFNNNGFRNNFGHNPMPYPPSSPSKLLWQFS